MQAKLKIMNRIIVLVTILLVHVGMWAQNKNPQYIAYIEKYRDMAIEQQVKYKIPAAITIAQGLLESAAGQSKLAVNANNHFGIKCTSDWIGRTYSHDDDQKDECFRRYATVDDSYDDHSLFLKRKRYESLFVLPLADYKSWAYGLKACGYATDPKYAEKLIGIIEAYHLQDLTLDSTLVAAGMLSEKDTTWNNENNLIILETTDEAYLIKEHIDIHAKHALKRINGIPCIIAQDGDTYASLAIYLKMYERSLRKHNDALDIRELKPGDIVYIYPKKNKASRKTPYHYFKQGEDAWTIAQKYGIKVKSLYKMNGIPYGTPLKTAQRLSLR